MPKNRNPSRAQRRRANPEGMAAPARPGAQKHKAMGKALSPKGQDVLKQAKQKATDGDHAGAAQLFRKLGEHMASEGNAQLSARAYLRAARSLHLAGKEGARDQALGLAIEQAKATGDKKKVMSHFRDLVRRVRSNGNAELADHLQAEIMKGLGKSNLGRTNAEGQPRTGGGRRQGGGRRSRGA
jgi:hypothetical protein